MKLKTLLPTTLAILMLAACGGKMQRGSAADNNYDFEAIAKAIDGCEYLWNFCNGAAVVIKNGEKFYIDLQGRRVERPQEKEEPDKLTTDYKDGKYGFKDQDGKIIIPHRFRFAADFSEGMALVVNEKMLVGYINTKGELVVPYTYYMPSERNGNDFHEGICAVVVDGAREWFSYIDKTGKLAFPGVFSMAGDFSEGLAAVSTTDKREGDMDFRSGYIDRSGKMVIELPDRWWGRKFQDGVAQIQNRNSCYIIDKKGKQLFKVDSEAIYAGSDIVYSEGLSLVYGKGKYEGKRGFMDKKGRITFRLGDTETYE